MRRLAIGVLLLSGVANAEPAPKPKLTFGTPIKLDPVGDLDAAILERTLESNRNKLLDCYAKELPANRTLQGTVTAQFTIDGKGAVTASTASGLKNLHVESCMADVIKHITFSKPKNGGNVAVSYPMMLEAESKQGLLFDDKNRKVIDQIIDRPLQTKLSKFSGTPAPPMAKGSATAGRDDGTSGGSSTGGGFGTGPKSIQIAFEPPSGDFGGLTAEEISRVVKARAGIFRACYQKQLNQTPGVGGKLIVHFVVGGDGAVQAARTVIASGSTMHNDAIENCVKININRLKFPARNAVATINYAFGFSQGS
jgi:hypothetical protein